jgi:hypothetical protein
VPYVYNAKARASAQGITDIAITLGYQLTEQSTSRYWPDIRLTLQQIFPVGKYLDLDPLHNGTDAIGLGSYQTGLGIIFQHVKEFKDDHYLRTRLSFNLLLPANVSVTGFNSFGGASDTKGVVTPGRFFGVDLAGEYNLTQNWVAVMEFYYSNRVASGFSGYPGRDAYGKLAQVGLPSSAEYSLAPAIEYNFTPNLGMIVGYWFTIAGHETTKYKSVVLALNTFW